MPPYSLKCSTLIVQPFFVLELDIASQAWKSSKINAELLYMTADFER